MTAICKTILIHNTNLQHLLDYGSDQEKTSVSRNGLSDVLYYGSNPAKTLSVLENGDKERLVTGVLCQPETAVLDFGITREKYLASHEGERYACFEFLDKRTNSKRLVQKEPVTAIHLIQSFQETDLNPRTVHQVGIELCEKLGVQAVVDTHMNKEHLHNHIIINAYLPDGVSKLCMDSAKRLQIRELSDTIQRSYGIEITFADPRTQLFQSKGRGTYREWDAVRKNISWKEEMKEFIKEAQSVSENKEDFLTIMQDNGYAIANQTVDSVTWWNKSHTRKIRDTTLGMEYKLGTLFPDTDHSPEYEIRNDKVTHKPSKPISIARYDWNGRRRSDLEILIRKALEILRRVGNHYQPKTVLTSLPTTRKIEMMEQALSSIQKLGLEQKSDLDELLNETGAKLNHIKSQLRKLEGQKTFYDSIAPILSAVKSYRENIGKIQYWPDGSIPDLMLTSYTPEEIQNARAVLCPMTGTQKRELYLTLKAHPEYTLSGNGFSGVSSIDAENIFAFFKGTALKQPECLKKSTDAVMEKLYHKRNSYLKEKFNQPIQKSQIEEITALLDAHGKSMNVSALTQFDVINIRNCYGDQPCVSKSTDSESQINTVDAQNLQTFLDAKGITIPIPVTSLSRSDYNKLFGYTISRGQTPDCVKQEISDQTKEFLLSIQKKDITEKKQLLLLQLRNQMNELLELGVDPFHTESISAEILNFQQNYEMLEQQRLQLSNEYKSLLQLSQQLSYAQSSSFLFGPLFDEKVHHIPEIMVNQEKDIKQPVSEGRQETKPSVVDVEL